MKKIPLTKGKFALVDNEDYGALSKHRWSFNACGYAFREIGTRPNRKVILMHRVILNAPKNRFVDHANQNRIDNRKNNIRLCRPNQNTQNQKLRSDSQSGIKGVRKRNRKGSPVSYQVRIGINSARIHVGEFKCPKLAAAAYDEAAKRIHGKFARTNAML